MPPGEPHREPPAATKVRQQGRAAAVLLDRERDRGGLDVQDAMRAM